MGAPPVPNSLQLLWEKITALGNSSTRNVGTTAGTVAAGDDSRFGQSAGTGRTLKAATRWYLVGNAARVSNAIPNESWENAQRFVASRSTTLTSVAVKVATAGSTGAVLRIGIRAEGSNGLPGAVLAQGTVDPTTTGIKTLTVSVPVVAGTVYYVCTVVQGGATTRPSMESVNGDGGDPDIGADTTTNAFNEWALAHVYYPTTGAMVDAPGTWGVLGTVPRKMISAAT